MSEEAELFEEFADDAGDPIDEFTQFPSMEGISFRQRDLEERAKRGMADSDMWNAFNNIYWLYAEAFRSIATPEANLLLQSIIDTNEETNTNTVPYTGNAEKFNAALKAHATEYAKRHEEAVMIWSQLYEQVLPAKSTLSELEVLSLRSDILEATSDEIWNWNAIKDILPDPTVVDESVKVEHLEARSRNGYSKWDFENFPTYIHWVIMNTSLWLGSDQSKGYPARYEGEPDKWRATLRAFIEGLIYGTYYPELSERQHTIYQVAVWNMLDYFPDFWD